MAKISPQERQRRISLIQQHEASGMSARNFCVKHGIDPHTFYDWRDRLKKQGELLFREVMLQPEEPLKQEVMAMKIGDCMLGFMSLPDSKWLSSLMHEYSRAAEVSC
jgi:transposase-like protein